VWSYAKIGSPLSEEACALLDMVPNEVLRHLSDESRRVKVRPSYPAASDADGRQTTVKFVDFDAGKTVVMWCVAMPVPFMSCPETSCLSGSGCAEVCVSRRRVELKK